MQHMRYLFYLFVAIGLSLANAGSYDDFFRAVVQNDSATIRQLVARGFDPDSRDPAGQPAIIRALQEQSNEAALTLAGLPGSDVDALNSVGETPLMIAAL